MSDPKPPGYVLKPEFRGVLKMAGLLCLFTFALVVVLAVPIAKW